VDLLRRSPVSSIDKVVYLTQGRLYPNYLGIELGIAEKLAIKAIAAATGEVEDRVSAAYRKTGDLGTVAEDLLRGKGQLRFGGERLTVDEVYATFDKIARSRGPGSTESKIKLLTELLAKSTPAESKFIIRMAVGKLRLGVADMTILDALAVAHGDGKDSRTLLERAYNLSSDLGVVATTLLTGGMNAIESFKVTVGKPIRPMLAERLSDPREILDKMNGTAAAEYKYDGLRVQAHVSQEEVTLFSRRMENITDQFPDVQKLLKEKLAAKEAIVEGEAVPVDSTTGDIQPFQAISQRRGRKYDLERMVEVIPIALFLFDLLYLNGRDYTQDQFLERRNTLGELVEGRERLNLSSQIIVNEAGQLDKFMEQAIADGCEGLMIKSIGPDSAYNAGARGWNWIKYKRDYKSEMQDTVDLVVVGAFSGRGRRGGTYGAVLLAAYDQKDDVFRTVCKCGSGFKDEDLSKLASLLKKYLIPHRHARVDSKVEADAWFTPDLVLEVTGAEITLSPVHTCGIGIVRPGSGLAIRFPRFTGRWRDDKSPEEATTQTEVIEMYQTQLKKLG